MALISLSPKTARIIVWVLDAIVLIGVSGQDAFGYVLPDVTGVIGIVVAVLSAVFGIFWQPKT